MIRSIAKMQPPSIPTFLSYLAAKFSDNMLMTSFRKDLKKSLCSLYIFFFILVRSALFQCSHLIRSLYYMLNTKILGSSCCGYLYRHLSSFLCSFRSFPPSIKLAALPCLASCLLTCQLTQVWVLGSTRKRPMHSWESMERSSRVLIPGA